MVISHPDQCGINPELSEIPVKLAAPARRALLAAKLTSLEKLSLITESQLLELHGMGIIAVDRLKSAMNEAGLSFEESRD